MKEIEKEDKNHVDSKHDLHSLSSGDASRNIPRDCSSSVLDDSPNSFREVITPKGIGKRRKQRFPGPKDITLFTTSIDRSALIPYVVFTISMCCHGTRWNVRITQKQLLRLHCRLYLEALWHWRNLPVKLPWKLFVEKSARKRVKDGPLVEAYLQRLLAVSWIRTSLHMQAFLEFSHTRISLVHGPSLKEGYAHVRLKGHANTTSKRFGHRINHIVDVVVNLFLWLYFIAFFVFVFVPLATLLFVSAPIALITGNVKVIQFPSSMSHRVNNGLNYCAFFILWIVLCLFLFYAFKFFESRMFREVRWVVLKPSCLAFYKDKSASNPSEVVLFDEMLKFEKSTIRQGLLWMPNGLTVDTKMGSVEMDIGHKYAVFLQAVCFIGSYLIIANNYIDDGDSRNVSIQDYTLVSPSHSSPPSMKNVTSGTYCGIFFRLSRDGIGLSLSTSSNEYKKLYLVTRKEAPAPDQLEIWESQSQYQSFQLSFDSFRLSFTNFLRNSYFPGGMGTIVGLIGEPRVPMETLTGLSGQSFSSKTVGLNVAGLISLPNNRSAFMTNSQQLCAIPFGFSGAGFWSRVSSMLGTCVIGALLALVSMHIISILFSYIGIWHASTRRNNWLTAFQNLRGSWNQTKRYRSFAPERKGKKVMDHATTTGTQTEFAAVLGSEIKFHVDGKETFKAMYDAINNAKYQIMICGWWVTPDLYLIRPALQNSYSRLDDLLHKKAMDGVQIYILLYREVSLVLTINSWYTKRQLRRHENIHILRDPAFQIFDLGFWSHHEKMVCIDQNLAFVGGLDLCFGRYDTKEHTLSDNEHPYTWVGKDYSNPRVKDFTNLENPFVDLIDRQSVPRMPWHDIHCSISGLPAQDAARHFIQRWNYAVLSITYDLKTGWCRCCRQRRMKRVPECILPIDLEKWIESLVSYFPHHRADEQHRNESRVGGGVEEESRVGGGVKSRVQQSEVEDYFNETFLSSTMDLEETPYEKLSLWRLSDMDSDFDDDPTPSHSLSDDLTEALYPVYEDERTSVDCQLLRSVSKWSCGVPAESSIQSGYMESIRNANHFVYIENQFFVSGLDGTDAIKNRIVQAIVDRIALAIQQKKNFRVMVVMPLLPAFEGDVENGNSLTNLHAVMHWQYQTISRGRHCLFSALQALTDHPEKYIGFFGLRTHEVRGDGFIVTEQIYVHSKVMIIDDKIVLIGSANINDRSMNGSRDSEVALLVSDILLIPGLMDGEPAQVGLATQDLRMQLFREHLGIEEDHPYYKTLLDPCCDESWEYIGNIAKKNTAIYENIFYCAPSNSMRSYQNINGYKLMTLFENQRRKVTRTHRWAPEHLTDGDPSAWTDVCGRAIPVDTICLDEWMVIPPDEDEDLPTDDEGWQYAPDFNTFGMIDTKPSRRININLSLPTLHWGSHMKVKELSRLLAHVRRRKWVRCDIMIDDGTHSRGSRDDYGTHSRGSRDDYATHNMANRGDYATHNMANRGDDAFASSNFQRASSLVKQQPPISDRAEDLASFCITRQPSIELEDNDNLRCSIGSIGSMDSKEVGRSTISPDGNSQSSGGGCCEECKYRCFNNCNLYDRRNIQGHLVEFPLDFLADEVLRPNFLPKDLYI